MAHWRYYKDAFIPARICMAEWWCTRPMELGIYVCYQHNRFNDASLQASPTRRRKRKEHPW